MAGFIEHGVECGPVSKPVQTKVRFRRVWHGPQSNWHGLISHELDPGSMVTPAHEVRS